MLDKDTLLEKMINQSTSTIIRFDEDDITESYNQLLDVEGPKEVAGCSINPSDILSSCDPIAYRCGRSDYESMNYFELESGEYISIDNKELYEYIVDDCNSIIDELMGVITLLEKGLVEIRGFDVINKTDNKDIDEIIDKLYDFHDEAMEGIDIIKNELGLK